MALTLLAFAIAGCSDDSRPGTEPTPESPAGMTADCGDVMVPGHEAVDIRAGGVDCALAKLVAAAAEGRGRAPYEAEGFRCEPADAGEGDTSYSCTRSEAAVRFRYGTA